MTPERLLELATEIRREAESWNIERSMRGSAKQYRLLKWVDELEALVRGAVPPAPQAGVERIAAERERQKAVEGWTPEHDDTHIDGEMIEGARCYLSAAFLAERGRKWVGEPPPLWPWNQSWWKPSDDPIRNLEKAGALIAAEIDRLSREALRNVWEDEPHVRERARRAD